MSLTSYRAAPPRDGFVLAVFACTDLVPTGFGSGFGCIVLREVSLFRFGGDLLSHVLRRSTIGATALNGRVRDGIGCFARAMTTKPEKRPGDCLFLSGLGRVHGQVLQDFTKTSGIVPSLCCF